MDFQNTSHVVAFIAVAQAVAKPARQFGHACKFKSLSLFISLEIDSFYSL